jgi:DNA mismatch repair protein MutH
LDRTEAWQKLQLLKGTELHTLAKRYGITVLKDNGKVNKGWAGHVFERYLGLPLNSSRNPNFGSWELKSIPLKHLKNGDLSFKETMAITMIDPVNVANTSFRNSHLLLKLKKIIIVARTVGVDYSSPSYVHSVTEINLKGKAYNQVETDYNLIRDTILSHDNGFNHLTGKMGVYIQPRTKGRGHGSKTRAFYARKRFLRLFIDLDKEITNI